jgi:hypothetical protein
MTRRKRYLALIVIILISELLYSDEKVKLLQDLSIGVSSGDNKYIFGIIGDLTTSSKGDIFVLDSSEWKIKKFSKEGKFILSIGGKGDGPGEFRTYPIGIEIDKDGNLFVAEQKKINIFNESGTFTGSFSLDFGCNDFVMDDKGRVIVLGLKDGKIFHIYNKKGENLFSFGKPLTVPEKYLKYKDFPNSKLPYKIYFTSNKRLVFINPYKYEIVIFDKENKLLKRINGKSKFYKPVQVMGFRRGVIFMCMGYSILEYEDLLYVSLKGEHECQMDIFKKDNYLDSIKIKFFPMAIDKEGRLYATDESDFPKIVRFTLKIQ